MLACPDENAIASFAQGELEDDAQRALAEHVDGCPTCQVLLVELARVLASDAPPPLDEAEPQRSGTRHVDPHGPTAALPIPSSDASPRAEETGTKHLEAGDHLGRYEIVGHLGSGGMGSVYRALDPQLGREVALKVVLPVGDVAALRPRLVREARALARLTHPNVVAVYDADVVERRAFVVMELVEGHTLDGWLEAAPRGWREVVGLVQQASEGLAAAHQKQLLHRDIKPANMLVGRDGRLRLSDFGLVAAAAAAEPAADDGMSEPSESSKDHTAAGVVVGTPAYMAPEQLWGQPASEASDQFALCVVLYEALFGTRPFVGSSVRELRRAVALHGPPWPARANGVPDAVIRCILKGLAQQPDQRHADVAAFLASLKRAVLQDADGHLRLNATLLAAACPLHVAGSIVMFRRMGDEPSLMEPGVGAGLLLIIYISSMLGWLMLGAVWAPANAYGLWHRRPWARTSTLIYAGLSVTSFIGAPYGVYALWSLTRPSVKAAFTGSRS